MSASLCMSMASLAVSGAGRGATVARMGRAATVGKGAVAGSAFMPAKTSAALTMKRSLAGASRLPSRTRAPRAGSRRATRHRARRIVAVSVVSFALARVDPPRASTAAPRLVSARARWPEKAKSPAALSLSPGANLIRDPPRSPGLPLTSSVPSSSPPSFFVAPPGVVMPRAVAARKTAVGGRGALVVVAGGNSIGCTLHGTRRARARTSGFRARLATPTGRKVLKARRKKGRKYLAPACAVNGWNREKKKSLK